MSTWRYTGLGGNLCFVSGRHGSYDFQSGSIQVTYLFRLHSRSGLIIIRKELSVPKIIYSHFSKSSNYEFTFCHTSICTQQPCIRGYRHTPCRQTNSMRYYNRRRMLVKRKYIVLSSLCTVIYVGCSGNRFL